MNYLKVYCNLIRKAENRTPPEGYTEKHHIFPKSIFGDNSRIVVLTAREHYIAHALLEKIYIKKYGLKNKNTMKMVNAIIFMKGNDKYYNSYLYEQSKKRFSFLLKNTPKSKEHREKISKQAKKRYENPEERQKISVQMKNYHRNVDTSGQNNSMYNKGCFYELISPNGKIGYTNKLKTFCEKNNFCRSAFCRIMANKQVYHKGWTIIKIT